MIDAAICGKKVVLYWPDFFDYSENSRDSYFDLESLFSKKAIKTSSEFKNIFSLSNVNDFFVDGEIIDKFRLICHTIQ